MKLKFNYIALIGILAILQQSCAVKKEGVLAVRSGLDSSLIKINLQQKATTSFPEEGVYFSNQFPSARLNKVVKQNDSTFNVIIEAENRPINSSAWYGFKIWAKSNRNIYLQLSYPDDKHRYTPKITKDGKTWLEIEQVKVNPAKDQAAFKLAISSDTLTVAAQEIVDAETSYEWMEEITREFALKKQVIGYSINGKPIVSLNSTGSNGKKIVVVISRQHPPEVTGYRAMQKFVRTLLADTELAISFRRQFELVVIPMINPDGVNEGNWRHSYAGVDLNRDWIEFKQPETRAVSEYLVKKVKEQNAKVYFALDFHSTFKDVLYSNLDSEKPTNAPGLAVKWIDELHAYEGKTKTPVTASGNGGNTSKGWFGRVLNAEGLTYEVGDNTPKELIDRKGIKTAEILMRLLTQVKN